MKKEFISVVNTKDDAGKVVITFRYNHLTNMLEQTTNGETPVIKNVPNSEFYSYIRRESSNYIFNNYDSTTSYDLDFVSSPLLSKYFGKECSTCRGDYHSFNSRVDIQLLEKYAKKTGVKIGVELETIARTKFRNALQFIPCNFANREYDGSLGSSGVEFIFPPVPSSLACTEKFWRDITEKLIDMAMSENQNSCGLHVHISVDEFKNAKDKDARETVARACNYLSTFNDNELDLIAGRHETNYCRRLNLTDAENMAFRAITDYGINRAGLLARDILTQSKSLSHYTAVFFNARYNTIELRIGKGTLNARRIALLCDWWRAFAVTCKRNFLISPAEFVQKLNSALSDDVADTVDMLLNNDGLTF